MPVSNNIDTKMVESHILIKQNNTSHYLTNIFLFLTFFCFKMEAWMEMRYDDYGECRPVGMVQYDTGQIESFPPEEFKVMCASPTPDPLLPSQGLIEFVTRQPTKANGLEIPWTTLYPASSVEALFHYQRSAIERVIYEMNGKAMLVFDPGLGKTFTAIMIAYYYFKLLPSQQQGASILVVTPTDSICQAFVEEFNQWVGLKVTQIKGAETNCTHLPVVTTTYASATMNASLLNKKWSIVILDESHSIKNKDAKRTKAMIQVARRARCTLLLSGTPRTKCNSELYAQVEAVLPTTIPVVKTLGTYEHFIERYCSARRVTLKDGRSYVEMGKSRYMGEVYLIMNQVQIRAKLTQEELDALPKKKRIKVEHEIDDAQALEELKRLERETNNPNLTKNQRDAKVMEQWRAAGRAKMPYVTRWVMQWLVDNPDKKLVIFAYSAELLKEYERFFVEQKITVGRMDGDVGGDDRQKLIRALRTPDDHTIRIGLISFGTGSLGITLCPGVYNCLIVEQTHVPTTLDQAENKVWRTGMKKDVTCYWFIATNTIERGILIGNQNKTNGNSRAIDNESNWIEFDETNNQRIVEMWRRYGLTVEEVEQIRISRLPKETDDDYMNRCTRILEDEEEDVMARKISCPLVTKRVGVKASLRGGDLIVILEPKYYTVTKRQRTE
jgi:SNF2 family DNA or RNA helicase